MTTPPNSPGELDPAALAAVFNGRRLLVCITGGIAAYKACTMVSRLAQAGAEITVAMTDAAQKFVTPLTFQALSANPVYTSQWQHTESNNPQHIALATRIDAAVIAPCSMNTLAKLVQGRTDDVVTLIMSAVDRAKTPVLLAPAMNSVMWAQPSTQRNTALAAEDGFTIVGPGDGWQACRAVGSGRMAEPEQIVEALAAAIAGK